MNLLNKIRSFFGLKDSVSGDISPLDHLDTLLIEKAQLSQQLEESQLRFDTLNRILELKMMACDKLIEKGEDIGMSNKLVIEEQLDKVTNEFITEVQVNIEQQNNIDRRIVDEESALLVKAIQLTAELSDELQNRIKNLVDLWQETGLVKGEEVDSQAKAITLVIEEIIKGEEVETAVEGHYANAIVKKTFKEGDKSVEKVLFLKRAPNKVVAPNQYCLPGGHIDEGETIEQAAMRELKEEANLPSNGAYMIGKVKCADGKWAFYLHIHPEHNDVALLDGESINACWMSKEEWLEADLFFDLKQHLLAIESPGTTEISSISNIEVSKSEQSEDGDTINPFYEEDEFQKAFDDEELIKGKVANEGEERTWGSKKYKKSGGKWKLASSGKKEKPDFKSSHGDLMYNNKDTAISAAKKLNKPENYSLLQHEDKHIITSNKRAKQFTSKHDDVKHVGNFDPKGNHSEISKKDQPKLATDQLAKHAENTSTDQLKKVAKDKSHPHNDPAKRELERRAGEEGSVKDKRKILNDFKKEITSVLEQSDYNTDDPKVQKVLDKYMEMDSNAFDSDDLDGVLEKELQKGNEKKKAHHQSMHEYHTGVAQYIKEHINNTDELSDEAKEQLVKERDEHISQAKDHKKKLEGLDKKK